MCTACVVVVLDALSAGLFGFVVVVAGFWRCEVQSPVTLPFEVSVVTTCNMLHDRGLCVHLHLLRVDTKSSA